MFLLPPGFFRCVLEELLLHGHFGTGLDGLRHRKRGRLRIPQEGSIPTFFEKSGRAGGDLIQPSFAETAGANKRQ